MKTFEEFLLWEAASRDTIDFKVSYVDLAGDLCAGLLLSQLIYWYLPARDGRSKARIYKDDGGPWIAKTRDEWYSETRLSHRQQRSAEKRLAELGILEVQAFRFNGLRMNHYRLKDGGERLASGMNSVVPAALEDEKASESEETASGSDETSSPEVTKRNDRMLRNGATESTQTARPLTETTNKDYSKKYNKEIVGSASASPTSDPSSKHETKEDRERRIEQKRKLLDQQRRMLENGDRVEVSA